MADEEMEVGSVVLAFEASSGEWKAAEIMQLLPGGGARVHFEDEAEADKHVDLTAEEIQPLEPDRFQVGDQVMGYFEAESAFYPCEIVEVCESTYIVHFFDTPEQDLYELDETQLMEERVMEEGTPIFTFLDEDPDNERWAKGTVSQPTDTGYVVHLDGTPDEELIELAEDNVYPIEVQVGDQVYAWFESTENPANGEWLAATLKGITDVGYRVHFKFAAETDITELSPDRVRAEGDLMEVMGDYDETDAPQA